MEAGAGLTEGLALRVTSQRSAFTGKPTPARQTASPHPGRRRWETASALLLSTGIPRKAQLNSRSVRYKCVYF